MNAKRTPPTEAEMIEYLCRNAAAIARDVAAIGRAVKALTQALGVDLPPDPRMLIPTGSADPTPLSPAPLTTAGMYEAVLAIRSSATAIEMDVGAIRAKLDGDASTAQPRHLWGDNVKAPAK